MFESVLSERRPARGTKLALLLSAGVYALVAIAGALLFSSRSPEREREVEVTLFAAAPAPAPPPPPLPAAAVAAAPPAAGAAPRARLTPRASEKAVDAPVPTETAPTPPEAPARVPAETGSGPAASGTATGSPGGDATGVRSGAPGGVPGGVPGGTGAAVSVLPFGPGMNRPRQIAGAPPRYSPQALAARVEGKVLVRCDITEAGTVEKCAVMKSVPMLDAVVLESLRASRFTPVLFQGRPVRVRYLFPFQFKLP